MKKFFVLAAAALVALTACTKVDTPVSSNNKKISFEVASYMAQTKAGTSLIDEGYQTFNTNAWYHSPSDGTQYFMQNINIDWNDAIANQWAPDADYFWPKTGYVNFYSYAGTQTPTTVNTEGSLVYTDKVIVYNDNVLVADAAYGYNANLKTYQKDNSATGEGVPTLFRHYLAKLAFNVKLATTDAKKTSTNRFKVEILDASVKVSNKGTLTLSSSDPETDRDVTSDTPTYQPWTNANTANANVAWVPATWGEATIETIKVVTDSPVEGQDMFQRTLNLGVNKTAQTETDNNLVLLASRTVMPQVLTDNQVFYIKYKVYAYHDTDDTDNGETPYSVETLEFSKPLKTFASAITEWDKNTKYIYNVIIDPIASKITFDPAVEAWADTVTGDFNPWLN
ncbi:MAG: hypothetical protein K6G92_08710 [Bacteroidaceae bacterium]|nr:hypothetical protein [Bacteroidaceae bacterium]